MMRGMSAHPSPAHPFQHLTPGAVLDALQSLGVFGDGRLLQLNSYENRVFQVHLEAPLDRRSTASGVTLVPADNAAPAASSVVVAKFYRPQRWTDAQIAEEHAFAADLAANDLAVVAPLPLGGSAAGATLGHAAIGGHDFRIAVYPRRGGHGPETDDPATLCWLGRFVGRMHAVGARAPFVHRRRIDVATYGRAALQRVLALDAVPEAQRPRWQAACERALAAAQAAFGAAPPRLLRVHGDCHRGNILWRTPEETSAGSGPHIVDLDDAATGPAVQDLWLLLSGERDMRSRQLSALLAGYRQFRDFDRRELALIEALRTLRMVHHSAWLAERWDDPAFAPAFPWFGSPAYWQQQADDLDEQLQAMAEPPLQVYGAV